MAFNKHSMFRRCRYVNWNGVNAIENVDQIRPKSTGAEISSTFLASYGSTQNFALAAMNALRAPFAGRSSVCTKSTDRLYKNI
jgi:hypothetical protein